MTTLHDQMTTLHEQMVTINTLIPSKLIINFQPNMPSQTCTPCAPCPVPETVPKKKTSGEIDKEIDVLNLHTATIEQCIKTSTGNVTTAFDQVVQKEKELDAFEKQMEALKKQMEAKQQEVGNANIKFAREHKELDINNDKMNRHQESLKLLKEEREKLVLEEKAAREIEEKEAGAKIAAFRAKLPKH